MRAIAILLPALALTGTALAAPGAIVHTKGPAPATNISPSAEEDPPATPPTTDRGAKKAPVHRTAVPSGDAPISLGPTPTTVHKEGDYGGVTPGEAPKTDHPRPKHMPAKGTLSWIGFEAKDGGAQLFFQSVAPFELEQHMENGVLVVHLGGLARLGQNTWRAVDTRFFDNPLARVEAKYVGAARATKTAAAHGSGIEVRISFKNAKDAHEGTTRAATEADGFAYQYLSFGAGVDHGTPTISDPEK